MLNKKDPLIDAIQQVMQSNQADRDAVKAVNEKFGIQDRKVLPHERQGEWDAAYQTVLTEGLHPNQQKLDVHEPEKDKLTKHDFKMLRSKKKPMEEGSDVTSPSSMGISKPDYATGTPDYAKSKEQTPNRAAKTSLPAGTMKEAKSNPYAIGMAAVKKSTGDEPPMEKKNITKAHEIAKKILAKKKMNEGFNNRHNSSVTASAVKQVVAEQAKARSDYGLGAAAAPKDAAAARAKIDTAMEPVVNTVKAFTPGATAIDKASQGDYKGAAIDAGIDALGGAAVGGVVRTGKALINFARGSKAATGVEKVTSGVTKALPTSAPVKPVSVAAREGGSAVPKVPKGTGQGNRIAAQRKPEDGPWGSSKPPEVKAPARLSSPSGTFAANLQKARQSAQSGRVGGSTVSATQQATKLASRSKLAQNAQSGRVGGSTVSATQQATKLAVRQRMSATAKDIRAGVGRVVNKVDDVIKKNPKAAAAVAAGTAGVALGRSISTNNPPPVSAAATQTSGPSFEKTGRGSAPSVPSAPSAATPAKTQLAKPGTQQAAKPGTQQAVKDRVVQKVATRSKLQTRNQRDDTIGASGRPTKGPGGITTGKKTGTTFSTKPGIAKKAPVGTGRVK